LHRLHPTKYTSPECTICKAGNEDIYHIFVDCSFKWVLWIDALQLLHLSDLLPTQRAIGHALVTLRLPKNRKLRSSSLCQLAYILPAIWMYHWHCVIGFEFW
ncbi:hypothetical protein K492DRAFT_113473, partial [Lichtheimia hyalospora FSU 10163]